MANFNSFCVMVALFLASGAVMVSTGLANTQVIEQSIIPASEFDDVFPPTPSIDDYDYVDGAPPEPAPELPNFLDICVTKLTEECGEEIFVSIFKSGTYSDDCCRKLVLMGKPCHNAMVRFIVSMPEFKANASETLPKSEQVWKKCVSVAANLSPTPSSSSSKD